MVKNYTPVSGPQIDNILVYIILDGSLVTFSKPLHNLTVVHQQLCIKVYTPSCGLEVHNY